MCMHTDFSLVKQTQSQLILQINATLCLNGHEIYLTFSFRTLTICSFSLCSLSQRGLQGKSLVWMSKTSICSTLRSATKMHKTSAENVKLSKIAFEESTGRAK